MLDVAGNLIECEESQEIIALARHVLMDEVSRNCEFIARNKNISRHAACI